MAAPLQIQLTPEEDRLLLELSLDPKTHKKTRLWAAMVRLAAEGWTAPRIARHFHKDRSTVYLVLRRFLEQGLPGLAYRKPPGAPRKFTPQMAAFLEERLAEDRTWTAPQLAEALAERFGVRLAPKVISRHLRAMGYVWKRTRYVPLGRPTEEEMKAFAAEEEEAKRGRALVEHAVPVPAVHLVAGAGSPAPPFYVDQGGEGDDHRPVGDPLRPQGPVVLDDPLVGLLEARSGLIPYLRVLLDLDPRDVKKEGVLCSKIVSTPFTILTRKPFWWLPTFGWMTNSRPCKL
ncbi:helix-turn-helix domain-containing protein, partial [Thermus scotoductus]|uniref:helix-turn-helix domain-containing protein n=1 Tax=Thermus scotoductus TaxID=37636 RepID=UPI0020A5CC3E